MYMSSQLTLLPCFISGRQFTSCDTTLEVSRYGPALYVSSAKC